MKVSSSTLKKIGFFALLFYLYLIIVFFTSKVTLKSGNISIFLIILSASIICLSMFGYVEILKPFEYNTQGFEYKDSPKDILNITPAKLCRGGDYLWKDGVGERSKMCNQLVSTPEGQKEIDKYNCCGMVGMPTDKFEYTPLSNHNWKNERGCDQCQAK